MAAGSWTYDVETTVPAHRIYAAAIRDWHNLGPKIAPHVIISAFVVSGDGSVGSVRQFNYNTEAVPFAYEKERVDFVDDANFEVKGTLIEGGLLGSHLETASVHGKVVPTAGGGSVVKVVGSYTVLPGKELDEALLNKAKEGFANRIKGTEQFLLGNPDAYN